MKKILINALIIIVTSLLFNTVTISFRVYLSNKIGTEGIGLYQLIASVYMVALLFVVSGINTAVSRLVAEEGGRASFPISKALIVRAVSVSFLYSIPAFLFLFFGAEFIGSVLLGDERTVFALQLLAVGMPFAGVSACIKGYFYAVSKIMRPVGSQAVELGIQILIIVKIMDYFALGGPEYACAAIAVGGAIAELSSCMYLLTIYRFERKKNDGGIAEIFYQNRILKRLLYISFPISAGSLVRTCLKTLENIMIPVGFERYGFTKKAALEEYGKIQGMVMPVLLFPASVILAFSSLLIPDISEANALGQKKRIHSSVERALQLTFILSILVSGLFFFFSEKLGPTIYEGAECEFLMKVLAPLIPLIYVDVIANELLQGLDQQISVLQYNIADAVTRIVLIFYLLPVKEVVGLITVMYASNLFSLVLSLRRLLKVTRLDLKVGNWIVKPILSIAGSGLIAILWMDFTGVNRLPDIIYIVAGMLSVSILYFIFLVRCGCLTRNDFRWLRSIVKAPVQKDFLHKKR